MLSFPKPQTQTPTPHFKLPSSIPNPNIENMPFLPTVPFVSLLAVSF